MLFPLYLRSHPINICSDKKIYAVVVIKLKWHYDNFPSANGGAFRNNFEVNDAKWPNREDTNE